MSIITKAAATARAFVMRWLGAGSSLRSWFSLGRTRRDYKGKVGDGRGNSIVVACVNWIARTFPEAPVQVTRAGEDGQQVPIPDHPMATLLENPNPFYPGELLMQAVLIDRTLTGNAYIVKERNGFGLPIALWWVPSSTIEPRWPQDGLTFISHYDYNPGNGARPIHPDDVIHFRHLGIDPNNTRLGISPLASLWREIFTDDEAANFSASLLTNFAVPGMIVSPSDDSEITADEAKVIKEGLMQRFGGDKRGEPGVFSAKTKVDVVAWSPQQMDLGMLRQIPEERISAVIGVPAAVVGLGTGLQQTKVGATMRELREQAFESNLVPTYRLVGAELRTQLLVDFEPDITKYRVGFDMSQVRVLQEDVSALWERTGGAVRAGWLMVSRAKELVGEKPLPGDNVYLRSIATVEVGPDATPFAIDPSEGGKALSGDDAIWAGKAAYPGEAKATATQRSLVRQFRREATKIAKEWARELDGGFVDLGDSIEIEVFPGGKALGSGAAGHGDNGNGHKQGIGPDELIHITLEGGELVEVTIPDGIEEDLFKGMYEAFYSLILTTTDATIATTLGIEVGVNLEDLVARGFIAGGGERITAISEQTKVAVTKALAEGRAAGDGAQALGRRIRGMVEGRSMYPGVYKRGFDAAKARGWGDVAAEKAGDRAARQYRAETIARTETKTAQNQSTVLSYQANPVVIGITVFDGAGCGWTEHDDPVEANGRQISFAEAAAQPLSHPRCVRSFGPTIRSASDGSETVPVTA